VPADADSARASSAVMVDKENEQPVERSKFAVESRGGEPSKGLGAQRPEGKGLGMFTPSKAKNVGERKRGVSMLQAVKTIAKKASHAIFPKGTRRALPDLRP